MSTSGATAKVNSTMDERRINIVGEDCCASCVCGQSIYENSSDPLLLVIVLHLILNFFFNFFLQFDTSFDTSVIAIMNLVIVNIILN